MAGDTSKANDPFTRAKKETYDGFMRFATVGTVFVALIVVLVVRLLTL